MMTRLLALFLGFVFVTISFSARAAPVPSPVVTPPGPTAPTSAERDAEGRRHFERGQELYRAKRFVDAARAFEAGYEASQRPQFLFNVGQTYRRAGDLQKAKDAYEKLLRLDPNTPRRQEVEENLASIEDVLEARAAAVPSPPPPPPKPGGTSGTGQVAPNLGVAGGSAPPPPPYATPPPPAKPDQRPSNDPSVFARPWFWVVVGGVVAAAATTTVLLLRSSGGSSCPGDTVCLTER